MKPTHYDKVAEFFDFFSNPMLQPATQEFVDRLADTLPKKARVVDAGGGTGSYTEELLDQRADLTVTFIEPAAPMMAIARTRISEPNVLHEATLDDVLADLEPHDAFTFNRSLYAFYGEADRYRDLFRRVREKLEPGGYVCIWEFDKRVNPDEMKEYMEANLADDPEAMETLRQGWPHILEFQGRFNAGIDSGEITLFGEGELDALLTEAGFEEEFSNANTFIYKLPGSKKKKGWFGR